MAQDARKYFQYYEQLTDGREGLLLDTLDFYNNHSAIPMHVVGETEDDIDFVLDREVKKLLALIQNECRRLPLSNGYRAAVLLMVAYCLRKYKLLKILYVGGKPWKWLGVFCQLLHSFHPDSKLYWLTQQDNVPCDFCTEIKMPFAELLLPRDSFDVVLLDDTDESLISAMKNTIGLSLHSQGEMIVLSQRKAIIESFTLEQANTYELGADWRIGHSIITAEVRTTMDADTLEGAVANILQESVNRITLVQEALPANTADLDNFLQAAEDVEQYILLIYASLPSLEVKYLVNEWKRALLDYRLGWGNAEKVKLLGELLLKELQQ